MVYFVAFIIIYILHVILKLNTLVMCVLFLYAFWAIRKHRNLYLQAKVYSQRFFEVSLYLDTLLYAFVKEQKVELAVRDVMQTMPEGKMKQTVSDAHEYMMLTFDEVELLEEALSKIEAEYPCKRMHDVHQFMTHVEYYGGEIERPVGLLLADKSRWERRIKNTIAERKKRIVDIILSVAASLIICGAILYLPVMDVDISGEWLLQACSLIVIILDDLVIMKAQKYLAVDWICIQLSKEEDVVIKQMKTFRSYNKKKERRLSYILGAISSVLTVILFFTSSGFYVIGGLLLTLFCFMQHTIGHNLVRKNLTKEIQYAFPNWLLDLVLLLQSENVQVALQKSRIHVPGVLRSELEVLVERLEMQPESSQPYHQFLEEFAIPEIHSAMGILYSLSIGNSSNLDKQISELVEKNLEMLDVAEKDKLKNATTGMPVLFLVPVLIASFKLVVDLVLMMLQFLATPMI